MPFERLLDHGMLVSGEIIHDQMQFQTFGIRLIFFQETGSPNHEPDPVGKYDRALCVCASQGCADVIADAEDH